MFAARCQQPQTWLGSDISHSALKNNMHVLLKFAIDGMFIDGTRKIEPSRNKRTSQAGKDDNRAVMLTPGKSGAVEGK
ncbi:MAG: hypothetical protein ABJL17_05675 [Parvibaculum sp.]|uniref:hypothetical protein n=1 Tax=Parvibaculum sp. TaxID=2024848 RepID=UPI003267051C